jgi:hypothetical protein
MKNLITLLIILILLISCKHKTTNSFFDNLSKHCGKTYVGKSVFPEDPGDAFAGKELIMHVKDCSENEIRVPVKVGDDTSRTWVFTKTPKGLLLKHDHRHADGTPDEVTMYGGYANEASTALQNNFAADEHTAQLLPEAKTNVWSLSFDDDTKTFTYYLERHSKPRFKALFDIK